MATEHYEETILAAVKAALEAMTGSGFHYPVADDSAARKVVRAPAYGEELFQRLGSETDGLELVYYILLDSSQHEEDTSERVDVEARFDIVALYRFEADDSDPFDQPTPSRQTLQLRMEHDVEKRLRESLTTSGQELHALGDLINLEVQNAEKDAAIVYHERAAQVILRCMAHYDRHLSQP